MNLYPDQGRLAELRFFGGMTIEETGEAMGISPADRPACLAERGVETAGAGLIGCGLRVAACRPRLLERFEISEILEPAGGAFIRHQITRLIVEQRPLANRIA